jgi:uncharacterized membrane protein YgdD (TMEM256/DUF423 family)
MHRGFLMTGFLFGATAVILGAFGAHALRQIVQPEAASVFETGIRYQFYHTFALIVTAILYEKFPGKRILFAGYFFIVGMVLFCSSLYMLTFLKATGYVGMKSIGLVTPFGGLFFIVGWISLFFGILKDSSSSLKSV